MAKADRSANAARLPSLGRWRAPLFLLIAGLSVLAGGMFLWRGVQAWQHARQGEQTLVIRDQLLTEIGTSTATLRTRFDEMRKDEYVRADLEAGAFGDAASRVRSNWPALSDARAVDQNLSQAFQGDAVSPVTALTPSTDSTTSTRSPVVLDRRTP